MKNFCFLSIVLFLLPVLSGCWQRNNGGVTPDVGARLFSHNCVRCHQFAGQGGPSTVPGFSAPDIRQFSKTPEELVQIISYGYGKMPAFKDSISNEDISIIAEYVATNIEKHP